MKVKVTVYIDDLRDSVDDAASETESEYSRSLNERIHGVLQLYLGRKDSLVLIVDLDKKEVTL